MITFLNSQQWDRPGGCFAWLSYSDSRRRRKDLNPRYSRRNLWDRDRPQRHQCSSTGYLTNKTTLFRCNARLGPTVGEAGDVSGPWLGPQAAIAPIPACSGVSEWETSSKSSLLGSCELVLSPVWTDSGREAGYRALSPHRWLIHVNHSGRQGQLTLIISFPPHHI